MLKTDRSWPDIQCVYCHLNAQRLQPKAPTEVGAVIGYRSEHYHWIGCLSQLKRLLQSLEETPKFTVLKSISLDIVITSFSVVTQPTSVEGQLPDHNGPVRVIYRLDCGNRYRPCKSADFSDCQKDRDQSFTRIRRQHHSLIFSPPEPECFLR